MEEKSMNNPSRRNFIKLTGLGLALGPFTGFPRASAHGNASGNESKKGSFTLGLASYSFKNFTLTQTIQMAKRLDLKYLSLKDVHLPLKSKKEDIARSVEEISNAGLQLYAVGVIYMTNEAEVNQAFEYAKAAGARMIIGAPEHELLPLAENKVKEYDIALAIHNHGPGDKRFPSPESVYEKVKHMDSRVGLCLDIGHTTRIGIDPSESAEKYFDRLFDVHIKDVSAATAEGTTVEMGRGVIDIPKFLRTLTRLKYKGTAAFEFEKDKNDPLAGVAESVGYARGVLSVI
jgi:sugar phosphate isomerase/epimerase